MTFGYQKKDNGEYHGWAYLLGQKITHIASSFKELWLFFTDISKSNNN